MVNLVAIQAEGNVFALVSAASGAAHIASPHLASPTILSVFQMHGNMVLIESHALIPGLLALVLAVKVATDGDEERSHLWK